jgi:hypothetical protein
MVKRYGAGAVSAAAAPAWTPQTAAAPDPHRPRGRTPGTDATASIAVSHAVPRTDDAGVPCEKVTSRLVPRARVAALECVAGVSGSTRTSVGAAGVWASLDSWTSDVGPNARVLRAVTRAWVDAVAQASQGV